MQESNSTYINNLIGQYKKAMDLSDTELIDMNNFVLWCTQRQDMALKYIRLLKRLNLPNEQLYELNKGFLDSLSFVKDYLLVTPYNENIDNNKIVAEQIIYNNQNVIIKKDDNYFVPNSLGFITQNPYDYKSLELLKNIHNNSKYGIVVGIYGNIYDKDWLYKFNQMKNFKNDLELPYIEEIRTYDKNVYCQVVASKKLIKK